MVKMGLLPDPVLGRQTVTLADNTSGRFIDRWTPVVADPDSPCVWTRGMDTFDLPIAHGEGRFVPADDDVIMGETDYIERFVSALADGMAFATQFHPEKSAEAGLQLLTNFLAWDGAA